MTHATVRGDSLGDPAGMDFCLRINQKGWTTVYRYESIVTRLRPPSATPDKIGTGSIIDEARFSARWVNEVEPDFLVKPGEGIIPADKDNLRPYVQPVMCFANQNNLGEIRNCDKPGVSIVLQAHGAIENVSLCLDAILEHTDSLHELIIVHKTADATLRNYLKSIETGSRQVRLLGTSEKPKSHTAKNRAMALATQKYIALVDSDVVVTSCWLDNLIAAAEANPQAGLFAPVSNNIMGMQKLTVVNYNENTLENLATFANSLDATNHGRVFETPCVSAFCLLIKRELVTRIGGLDNTFSSTKFASDDYCIRARVAGYKSLVVPNCFVHFSTNSKPEVAENEYLDKIVEQWEIFKTKWDIPGSLAFNEPMDLNRLLRNSYDPTLHFLPLTVAKPEYETSLLVSAKE